MLKKIFVIMIFSFFFGCSAVTFQDCEKMIDQDRLVSANTDSLTVKQSQILKKIRAAELQIAKIKNNL